MKQRMCFSLLAGFCFLLCLLIVKFFSHDEFIRGFIGDFLVVILIYAIVKSIIAVKPVKMAVATLGLAYLTEFLQYLKLINWLGLEHNRMAQIIIGAFFDPSDLLAYTLGVSVAYLVDQKIIRKITKV